MNRQPDPEQPVTQTRTSCTDVIAEAEREIDELLTTSTDVAADYLVLIAGLSSGELASHATADRRDVSSDQQEDTDD